MDADSLTPGPDLSAFDFDNMDLGNELPGAAPAAAVEPEPVVNEPVVDKEVDKDSVVNETKTEEDKVEEQPREKDGKFAKKDKDTAAIPKARFDEAVNKERDARLDAERRLEELQAAQRERERAAQQTVQHDARVKELEDKSDELTKQHSKLLLDGDAEKAAEVMREIRQAERQIARLESQVDAQRTIDATLETERMNISIAKLEVDYPELNPKSESYDDDLVQTILLWQNRMVAEGLSPSKAMEAAAERVMSKYAAAKAPAKEAEPDAKAGLAATKVSDRKASLVEQAVAASKAQPPVLRDVGLDADKLGDTAVPDVSKMTFEEFNALPEATRARMRGDML